MTKQETSIQLPSNKRAFDLEERTLLFAKQIVVMCKQLPHDLISRELIAQLIRASGSVGANYREAHEAVSRRDFSYRIRIARKEVKEAEFWLQLLESAVASHHVELRTLQCEAREIRFILSSIATRVSSGLQIVRRVS